MPPDRDPSQSPEARIRHPPAGSRSRIEHLPNERIEHLRVREPCGSNTCSLPHATRIEHLRSAGPTDRTPPARSERCGSNTCAAAGFAETPFRLARTGGSNSCSNPWIEHLRDNGKHGSNTYGLLHAVDRTLARLQGGADRTDPATGCRRVETLLSRRKRGLTPVRLAPCPGSNTCAVAGHADRTLAACSTPRGSNTCAAPDPRIEHPPHAPNAADRTLARSPGAHGSNTYGLLHAADRHPSQSSETRIDTPPARFDPLAPRAIESSSSTARDSTTTS